MFLSEDVSKAIAFGDFVKKKANWNLSTEDAIELTRHFAWYNGVIKKIDEHVLELKRTLSLAKDPAEESKKGGV